MLPVIERPANAFFSEVYDSAPYMDYEGCLHSTDDTTRARVVITLVYEAPLWQASGMPTGAYIAWVHEDSLGEWDQGADIELTPEHAIALIQGMTHTPGEVYPLPRRTQ